MTHNKTDGQDITLDLQELAAVCNLATRLAREDVERELAGVRGYLEQEATAQATGGNDKASSARCNASTHADCIERSAKAYARVLRQRFFVLEALRRDGDIECVREDTE